MITVSSFYYLDHIGGHRGFGLDDEIITLGPIFALEYLVDYMVKLGTNVVEDCFIALIRLISLKGALDTDLTFWFSFGTI